MSEIDDGMILELDDSRVSEVSGISGDIEQGQQGLEKQLRETDPRDYIEVTAFQKHARDIDTDLAHLWEAMPRNYYWVEDTESKVAIADIFNSENRQSQLLMAVKHTDAESISILFDHPDDGVRGVIFDVSATVARRYPPETRMEFFRKLKEISPDLQAGNPDIVVGRVVTLAISLLPDDPNAQKYDQILDLPMVDYGEPEPTVSQREELFKFISILSTKMSFEDFQSSFNEFIIDIPFTDHIYGKNFKYIFTDLLGRAVKSREDTDMKNVDLQPRMVVFPVRDLIRRELKDSSQFAEVLSTEPVMQQPDVRRAKFGPTVAEFVDLKKIVGGPGITDWSVISTSEGRGIERVCEIATRLKSGFMDTSLNNSPIQVIEVNDNYFIETGGRHRVAAMKALGIPFAPMLTTHVLE